MEAYQEEPLEKLKTYPVFQHLRAKAETHALKFRPKESRKLQQLGQFERVLDERTQAAWNVLARMRHQGALLNEAEEFALPLILLPDENARTEDLS